MQTLSQSLHLSPQTQSVVLAQKILNFRPRASGGERNFRDFFRLSSAKENRTQPVDLESGRRPGPATPQQ